MKTMLALALSVLFAVPSQARLGESIAELKRHYGQSLGVEGTKEARISRYRFQWYSYSVEVTVREGLSVSEEFTRRDRQDFSLAEVQSLLAESSEPGIRWVVEKGNTWKQRDRVAMWSQRSLLVQGREL